MAITDRDQDLEEIVPLTVPDTIPDEIIEETDIGDPDSDENETEVFTLADAIREGAKLVNGQTTNNYFDDEGNACALGAAYRACKERGIV